MTILGRSRGAVDVDVDHKVADVDVVELGAADDIADGLDGRHLDGDHFDGGPSAADGAVDGVGDERRRGRFLGTLGSRLVAGVVVLVVLVVAVTGVATYVSLRYYLSGRLDQQLQNSANPIAISNALRVGSAGPAAGPRAPQQLWLAFLNPDGSVYSLPPASTQSIAAIKLTAAQRARVVSRVGSRETVTTTDGHTLRITALRLQTIDNVQIVGLVGLDTNELSRTLGRLVALELIVGLGALLLALGASAWGVSVGLGPLKRVTRTAQEVTAELSPDGSGLDRRVPGTGSGTEVGQLATSFNTMLDTVEREFSARRESEERMRQFLTDASHELRTPLTSIRGYAELARMQAARETIERADQAHQAGTDPNPARPTNGTLTNGTNGTPTNDTLARIEAEGTRMSRLVEDLLTLARGDDDASAVSVHTPVDVVTLVTDAVADVRLGQPDRPMTVAVEPGLTVLGDRDQILRVLRNLVTNAGVHTDPGGPIRVSGHREGDRVVVQVIDSGPGLSVEDAAHVFERFWRADRARTRVRGGSGLGMSIVAQIVDAHDGQVFFDSSVERGSTVTVILPAAADEHPRAAWTPLDPTGRSAGR